MFSRSACGCCVSLATGTNVSVARFRSKFEKDFGRGKKKSGEEALSLDYVLLQ